MGKMTDPAITVRYIRRTGERLLSEAIAGAFEPAPSHSSLSTAIRVHLAGGNTLLLRRARDMGRREFEPINLRLWQSAPLADTPVVPARQDWGALPWLEGSADFIDGLATIAAGGDVHLRTGAAIHVYRATRDMTDRYYVNMDGHLIVVPQQGSVRLTTEFGIIDAAPQEFALIPRGVHFAVALLDGAARGFVCESYGEPLRPLRHRENLPTSGALPELLYPVASFEEKDGPVELVTKMGGTLWATDLQRSPFDIIAWSGDDAPCKGLLSTDALLSPAVASMSSDYPIADCAFTTIQQTGNGERHTGIGSKSVMASRYVGVVQSRLNSPLQSGSGFLETQASWSYDAGLLAGCIGFEFQSRLLLRPTLFATSTPALRPK